MQKPSLVIVQQLLNQLITFRNIFCVILKCFCLTSLENRDMLIFFRRPIWVYRETDGFHS